MKNNIKLSSKLWIIVFSIIMGLAIGIGESSVGLGMIGYLVALSSSILIELTKDYEE